MQVYILTELLCYWQNTCTYLFIPTTGMAHLRIHKLYITGRSNANLSICVRENHIPWKCVANMQTYIIQIYFCYKLFTGYNISVKQYKQKWLNMWYSVEENHILKERTLLALLNYSPWRTNNDIK